MNFPPARLLPLAVPLLLAAPRAAVRHPLPPAAPHDTTYVIVVRADDMQSMLNQVVFTEDGAFYPCRVQGSRCENWGHDIALTNPAIKTDAARLLLSVHIKGTYPISQFFSPVVEGTLDLAAVPVVRDNLLRMTQTSVASGGGDAVFNGFLGVAHDQIAQYVNQNVKIDLARQLAAATGDPGMPPPRLPGLTCVDPTHLTLTSAATQQEPDAVVIAVHLLTPPGWKSRCA